MTNRRWRLLGGSLAFVLMIAHAVLSVYWALGGTMMLELISETVRAKAQDEDSRFHIVLWTVAFLKLAVALVALCLTARWSITPVVEQLQRIIAWITGILLTLYGVLNLLAGIASLGGIIDGPEQRDATFWAYLLLWAPWWTAIGFAFLMLSVAVSREPDESVPDRMRGQR